jgi:hypothetical protein
MPIGPSQGDDRAGRELRDEWFRQLDQRRINEGAREWAVQVTAILDEEDTLWIQLADDSSRWAGSILLCVRPTTSVEQAIKALTSRTDEALSYPTVIRTFLPRTLA